jgi:tRNA(fMet)-specific endonuclease VapC
MCEPYGQAATKALTRGLGRVHTSIVVAGELWHGAEKAASDRLRKEVAAALARISVLDLKHSVEFRYALLRTDLQRKGTPIGANDLWIAAHALSEGLTLVTDDEAEFSRVDGLAIKTWLR